MLTRIQWVDEDEQDEAPEDDYANNLGGLGGDPGAEGPGGLGNIDFSKLGGLDPSMLANMGAGGEGEAEGAEGAEGEEVCCFGPKSQSPGKQTNIAQDEDDMPELESADNKGNPKIQEVSQMAKCFLFLKFKNNYEKKKKNGCYIFSYSMN